MRRFLTIGIKPGGKVDILHSADQERSEHVVAFRETLANAASSRRAKNKVAAKYTEIGIVDLSRGLIRRKVFATDGDDSGGKRTVARTVKKAARKTRDKSRRRATAAQNKVKARAKAAKSSKGSKAKAKAAAPSKAADPANSTFAGGNGEGGPTLETPGSAS